jgi:hypothetical protein
MLNLIENLNMDYGRHKDITSSNDAIYGRNTTRQSVFRGVTGGK